MPDIRNAIATVPQDFYFDAVSDIIPAGMQKSFILDTSRLDAKVIVELPFHLKAQIYEITDTMEDMDLSGIFEDITVLDTVKIYNFIENHIPFEIRCQVYLIDSLNAVVDSLYTPANQPIVA